MIYTPKLSLDPVSGKSSLVTHIGLLRRNFLLLPAFTCLVVTFTPVSYSYQLGLFSFCICHMSSSNPSWMSSRLSTTPTIPMHLKAYLQSSTNILQFVPKLETVKTHFPRMVVIIWVMTLAGFYSSLSQSFLKSQFGSFGPLVAWHLCPNILFSTTSSSTSLALPKLMGDSQTWLTH